MRGRGFLAGAIALAVVLGLTDAAGAGEPVARVPRPDAEVFLDLFGKKADVRRVRRQLEKSRAVERFAFMSEEASRAELLRLFAHTPSIVDQASTYVVRPSFRVVLTDRAHPRAFRRAFRDADGVDHVTAQPRLALDDEQVPLSERFVLCQGRPDPDLEVFLTLDVTFAQQRAVRQALEQDPGVTQVRTVTPEEERRSFECALRRAMNPSALPQTFQVLVAPGTDLDGLRNRLEAMAGVNRAAGQATIPRAT